LKIILKIAQDGLSDICKSANSCPVSMRLILQYISTKANLHIPDYELACLGNIIFLRLFGTVLVSFKKIRLPKRPTQSQLRIGAIVAKLWQQLANSDGNDRINADENLQALTKQFLTPENQALVHNYLMDLISEKGLQLQLPERYSDQESAYQASNALCSIRNFITANVERLYLLGLENTFIRQLLINFLCIGFSEINIKRC